MPAPWRAPQRRCAEGVHVGDEVADERGSLLIRHLGRLVDGKSGFRREEDRRQQEGGSCGGSQDLTCGVHGTSPYGIVGWVSGLGYRSSPLHLLIEETTAGRDTD